MMYTSQFRKIDPYFFGFVVQGHSLYTKNSTEKNIYYNKI